MNALNPTQRFTDRVQDYARFRPDYPPALIAWLKNEYELRPEWRVADIGAGTGISTKLFLDAGCEVIAVEPNAAMRAAADKWLAAYPRYRSVAAPAEATTLPGSSADLVTAAQAFHWFDQAAVKAEWTRILRPTGIVALFWNMRRVNGTAFLEGYEALLREFCPEYGQVAERYGTLEQMRVWFGAGFRGAATFEHRQLFDFDGVKGRLLSSSYAPKVGDPRHAPMLVALQNLFERTQRSGQVSFDYDTQILVGSLGDANK